MDQQLPQAFVRRVPAPLLTHPGASPLARHRRRLPVAEQPDEPVRDVPGAAAVHETTGLDAPTDEDLTEARERVEDHRD